MLPPKTTDGHISDINMNIDLNRYRTRTLYVQMDFLGLFNFIFKVKTYVNHRVNLYKNDFVLSNQSIK